MRLTWREVAGSHIVATISPGRRITKQIQAIDTHVVEWVMLSVTRAQPRTVEHVMLRSARAQPRTIFPSDSIISGIR